MKETIIKYNAWLRGRRIMCLVPLFYLLSLQVVNADNYKRKAIESFKKGREYYYLNEWENAQKQLEKSIKKDRTYSSPYLLLGEIFDKQELPTKAFEIYISGVARVKNDADKLLDLATKLAIKQYWFKQLNDELVLLNTTQNKKLAIQIKRSKHSLETANQYYSNPSAKAINLPLGADVDYIEGYWPYYMQKENKLCYTMLDGFGYLEENLYAINVESGLKEAFPYPIKTNENEGSMCISKDGNWLFFASCNRAIENFQYSSQLEGFHIGCDLYFSRKTTTGWTLPVPLPKGVNTEHWEGNPMLSEDESLLYFSSNRPSSLGKRDIYAVELTISNKALKFGSINHFEKPINSIGNDMSPFEYKGKLFLASDNMGHKGMGGFDIYYSDLASKSTLINLGYPINTPESEYGITFIDSFLIRSRETRKSKQIEAFTLLKDEQLFNNAVCNQIDFSSIRFLDSVKNIRLIPDIILAEDDTIWSQNKEDAQMPTIPKNAQLVVKKSGYLSAKVSLVSSTQIVYLNSLKSKDIIKTGSAFFEHNSSTINDKSMRELDQWVSLLLINNDGLFEVVGYANYLGSKTYNLELSLKRAEAVCEYLYEKGVSEKQVKPIAGGEINYKQNDASAQIKDRRVELRVASETKGKH